MLPYNNNSASVPIPSYESGRIDCGSVLHCLCVFLFFLSHDSNVSMLKFFCSFSSSIHFQNQLNLFWGHGAAGPCPTFVGQSVHSEF